MLTTADMIDQWRDRRRPPKPARPRPTRRRFVGITFHRRHGKWVGRYKAAQRTHTAGEFAEAIEAAYARDRLMHYLTGGNAPASSYNFPHLFGLEAAS